LGILGKPKALASLSSDLQDGRFLARIGRHKYYVANEIVAKCQAGLGSQNYFEEAISVNGCDCVFVESGRAASDGIVDINAESRAGWEVRSPSNMHFVGKSFEISVCSDVIGGRTKL